MTPHRRSLPRLAALLLAFAALVWAVGAFTGCSAGAATVDDDAEPEAERAEADDGVEVDPSFLRPTVGGEAHVRLTGPTDALEPGDLVELVPRGAWPQSDDLRPAQVVLLVVSVSDGEADAVVVGQRQPVWELADLQGRELAPAAMANGKSVTTIRSVAGRTIRLELRPMDGVAPGDYYFILGEPAAEPQRLGSHIVGLVQVDEVTPAGARAQVVHQMNDFSAGDVAIFAHHAALDSERPEALILFARTDPNAEPDAFALPALADAVFDYQARFQFSNIRIETLDELIDPAAYDAAEQAQELAPDEGFGVIVFGEERAADFLYNITTYGTSPSLATSVGILPGGLPLPTPEGLAALSHSLAPSFLATAMTQRGDHAEVIYFLEHCLRTEAIAEPVAFHLREHLALRYESIDRPVEGLWLMDHDIAVARDTDNAYAELNALSIREYLHRSVYDFEQELDDLGAFLEAAEDVLPEESLLSERLEMSRVLGRLDRIDEGLVLLDEVIRDAQGQQRLRWEVNGAIARANLLAGQGNVDQAVTLLTETLPDARVLGESYPRYTHALLAQYLTEQNMPEEAMLNVQAALAYASTDEAVYSMASTHELAATIHFNFDNLPDAVVNMREAARLYGELNLFEDAARALLQAGMLELNAAVAAGDPRLLQEAYDHLSKAGDTFMAVGDASTAAQSYGAMGMVNSLLRQGAQAAANYGRTIDLGIASNEPDTVAIAWERLAELYFALEEISQAQLALQSARLWAQTFGLDDILIEIETLEQSMQNAI